MLRRRSAPASTAQTLRDWVIRYNEHGVTGLCDNWNGGRPPMLTLDEQAKLLAIVMAGPDPEKDGFCAFTRDDLVAIAKKKFGKSMHPASMGRVLRRLDLSRQKARPTHPMKNPAAAAAFKEPRRTLENIQRTHKNKRLRLYFQDEARIGQKGRVCHIWWKRGERPPGLLDQRYVNAYIYAAIEPGTDNAFALILPDANRVAMQAFLDAFAKTIANGEHVALVLDGAGWHSSKALRVPASITLVPLPPYSPELNPVERVWLHLKARFLSLRLLNDYKAIVTAASRAWRRLRRDTGRLTSLTSYPWIMRIRPQVKH